ncbi:SDR family oxidoreductase [Lactobacillus acetotolerans]|uniref:SDR family oxidoreductase n=1 Tax=Lactobacillus acetotolerans TaxID=1600 RepID=A0A5P5ZKH7_9LACO|nr:SDR family oxidoreductase [Lactobacillus acetotolerans]MCH3990628.1 SDR family oxidoreductase [Lactobacillus sp.]MCH4139028.1 SDR family oxidoreductase [Lactobacillus amylovorus]MCH4068656.1 SDR family oxidoreductase [Lactobacillus sp.]MCI1531028.1 SDR family oxidoreductase [Lactobacillus amylovorus]QFG51964.1 SDR family oxidoreductase [Lactobacillus acetotolerans]
MVKVAVLGAHGQVAQLTEEMLFADKDVETTLFLRNASRLAKDKDKATIIDGDATNEADLEKAIKGQDVVYANLAGTGTIDKQAQAVVETMDKLGVKRLIWISTLGIYDEVAGKFGEWNKETLGNYITEYAKAAKRIENSDLDYTIVRPSWMTNKDEVDYQKSKKGEPITNTEVSRKSIASYVYELIKNPSEDVHESIGLEKPGTEGDKPSWY